MFGLHLYIEIDYCAPGIWWTAEFVPLSWGAIKRVWREAWASMKGEGYFCDALLFVSRKEPETFSVLLASLDV